MTHSDLELQVMLDGIIARTRGAATWTDLLCGIMRAKERKVSDAIDGCLVDLPLEALVRAERLADKQFMKNVPPPLPTGKPAPVKAKR
jgi:hypothetical protein